MNLCVKFGSEKCAEKKWEFGLARVNKSQNGKF